MYTWYFCSSLYLTFCCILWYYCWL